MKATLILLLVAAVGVANAFMLPHLPQKWSNSVSSLHVKSIKSRINKLVVPRMAATEVDKELDKGMPSKTKFFSYFKKIVKGNEMSIKEFMGYDEVDILLNDEVVIPDDINDLWVSAVGDAKGLNMDEAYEMLCMVKDLPDPEDIEFLNTEFNSLTNNKGSLTFFKFVGWEDVQDMMDNNVLTMEEITEIWRNVAGDLNKSVDRKQFGKLNNALDDKIEEKESGGTSNSNSSDDDIDLSKVDIWDKTFDAKSVFDEESIQEMTEYFDDAATKAGGITLASIMSWSYIQDLLADNSISKSQVQAAWNEAVQGESNKDMINYDKFIRFNVKLDLFIENGETATQSTAEADGDDPEAFYRSEFKRITAGGALMRLDMLLDWSEIKELLQDKVVSQKQIEKMFEGMPKEPMGLPTTSFGITENTFVAFNGMLDVLLDAASPAGSAPSKASTPSSLVSEPARPMPKNNELKIGSLKESSSDDDDSSTGLSASEMELMSILDKADNMLNSGSYGDFDQLIGDMNDPRLQALREKRDGAEEVKGELRDIMTELYTLCKKQSRCGLDKPAEEEAARLRDLIQGCIEKAPKIAAQDINKIRTSVTGQWRLMYTNSEMFEFYNGVTGFANVFPASKFQDLSVQYQSDGFLSESKYFETLTTPLGKVDATVYSNWDIMKEVSFMTNENSVVVRNFCQKVTAGPMEYEAQENWKSLRTMSMNELLYVDDKIKIMRNCGALRIYFVYERI